MFMRPRVLIAAFSLALGGCATLNDVDTGTCVLKKGVGFSFMGVGFTSRDDQDNEECRAARAATTLATMRKIDGTPDMQMYAFAANLYRESTPTLQKFMDKMLKQQGLDIETIRFDLAKATDAAQKEQLPVSCERIEVTKADGTKGTNFKCMPRQ